MKTWAAAFIIFTIILLNIHSYYKKGLFNPKMIKQPFFRSKLITFEQSDQFSLIRQHQNVNYLML